MKLLIAGGGTGGHIFPGVAVAKAFEKQAPVPRVLFVGSKSGLESTLVPKEGFSIYLIYMLGRGLKGKNFFNKLKVLATLPFSYLQAIRLLLSFAPNVVLATGGSVAGIVCMAARTLGIPVVVQEQNTVPGVTNRIISKFSAKTFIAFEEARKYLPNAKISLVGNPIREEILKVKPLKKEDLNGKLCILIFGGSQGAHRLNQSLVDALPLLKAYKNKIEFIHQTGKYDFSWVELAYKNQNFQAKVSPFIGNMHNAYQRSHLVIARSGASILEVAACGRGSILVPFPFAADDHQAKNAQSFSEHGAAITVRNDHFSGKKCAAILEELINDRQRLFAMSQAALKLSRRQAAQEIAAECIELGLQKQGLKEAC